jgi:hypothetical protein
MGNVAWIRTTWGGARVAGIGRRGASIFLNDRGGDERGEARSTNFVRAGVERSGESFFCIDGDQPAQKIFLRGEKAPVLESVSGIGAAERYAGK